METVKPYHETEFSTVDVTCAHPQNVQNFILTLKLQNTITLTTSVTKHITVVWEFSDTIQDLKKLRINSVLNFTRT